MKRSLLGLGVLMMGMLWGCQQRGTSSAPSGVTAKRPARLASQPAEKPAEQPAQETASEEEAEPTAKKVLMIIAPRDFRDEELTEPKKILEQAGHEVTVACITKGPATGMLGLQVEPDITLDEVKVDDYDAIVFVGGAGVQVYWSNERAQTIAKQAVEQNKVLGAICLAPVLLARTGLLQGKKATVFSTAQRELTKGGAEYTGKPVEQVGNIITANGPESAQAFGEALAKALETK